MTYKIRFRNTNSLHESEPKTLEEARSIAISLSHWNQRVDIVDADMLKGFRLCFGPDPAVVERFEPYSEAGAQQLEAASF